MASRHGHELENDRRATSSPRAGRWCQASRRGPAGSASGRREVRDEVAGLPAPAERLEHLDLHGSTEGGLEDGLVGRPGALAVQVARPRRAVLHHGAVAAPRHLPVADMDRVTLAPGLEARPVGLDQLLDVALALLRDRPLELVTPEAAAPAALDEADARRLRGARRPSCRGGRSGFDRGTACGPWPVPPALKLRRRRGAAPEGSSSQRGGGYAREGLSLRGPGARRERRARSRPSVGRPCPTRQGPR